MDIIFEYYNNNFKKLLEELETYKNNIRITLIANVRNFSKEIEDSNELITEYFSENEIEEILSALRNFGFYTDIYFDEDKFMKDVIDKRYESIGSKVNIVYNWSKRGTGPGRKALIPAFCNLHNILTTGSDPYVVSLCRHKYHYNCILDKLGLPVAKSWLFSYDDKWLLNSKPNDGIKIIAKLTYESASIGLNNDSIIIVDENIDNKLELLSKKYNQPITVQEYIEGYEIEVPIFNIDSKVFGIAPIGISIDNEQYLSDKILTYETTYDDDYNFYQFDKVSEQQIQKIISCSENIVKSLGITGFGRIDFRVNKDGSFFVTDIATNPYTTKHSSFSYLFKLIGLTYEELQAVLIGAVCYQNNLFK